MAAAALIAPAVAVLGGGSVAAQQPSPTATATAAATRTATPAAAQGAPTPPNRFYGTVTLNGQPAPNGTTVTAMVGTTACGTGTVTASGGASNYVVDVQSSFTVPGCGTDGATVSFTVGTARATQTGTFATGAFTSLNLTAQAATPTPSPTPAPTRTATATPAPTRTATPSPTTAPRTPTAVATPPSQRPGGAPAAQAPRAGAAPALPRTGAASTTDTQAPLWLALAAIVVLGAGSVVAFRRR